MFSILRELDNIVSDELNLMDRVLLNSTFIDIKHRIGILLEEIENSQTIKRLQDPNLIERLVSSFNNKSYKKTKETYDLKKPMVSSDRDIYNYYTTPSEQVEIRIKNINEFKEKEKSNKMISNNQYPNTPEFEPQNQQEIATVPIFIVKAM